MGAGGAKRAPLQLERARFLVPPHESVPRRSYSLQSYSHHIQPHSTPQQRHRTHAVSGLHFQSSTLHGVRVRSVSGCRQAALLQA